MEFEGTELLLEERGAVELLDPLPLLNGSPTEMGTSPLLVLFLGGTGVVELDPLPLFSENGSPTEIGTSPVLLPEEIG